MAFSFTQIATDLISNLGYTGLGIGLFIDSFGVPIPSEILVPLGTILAQQGRFSMIGVFLVSTVAQTLGGVAGYVIGRFGGEPILERYGKFVLITKRDLDKTHLAFEKYGSWLTMVGRCVPGIRGLIAYPAGIAKMNFGKFIIFTAIGSAGWTLFLMYLGTLVGDHMSVIDGIASKFSLIGILILLVFLVWHFRHVFWRKAGKN